VASLIAQCRLGGALACDTAAASKLGADALSGLARVFFYAGVAGMNDKLQP
jgi:hypothetical protein